MKKFLFVLFLCVGVVLTSCTEDESSPVGDVYGIVSDLKSGAPVRNAEVIISPGNASTVSGSDGHFEFKSLTPGQYKISVEANGYSSNSRQVTVVAGQRISCDIHLAPEADNDVISINPTSIDFGTNELQIAATVTNESDSETEWFLDLGNTPWLYAYPTTGRIGGGKTHSIVFTANRARMNEDKSSVVNISAFGNTHPLSLKCKQSVQLSSVMVVESLNVDFGEEATEQIIRIRNVSETDVNWTLYKVQNERLSMSSTHGIVAPGGSQIVTIRLDREGLDDVLATTFMISDGTVDQPVNVIAYPTPEGATTTNKIFYTSTDGNIVEPYDPSAFGANIVSNTYEYGQGVITFDGDVTEIGYKAFYECATLASITIPETILEIANHAFTSCSALISINLPNSIKRQIGSSAFQDCISLTSIVIPGGIELIQDAAFGGCTSLTTVTILGRISDFSDGVFRDCINLSTFNGEYASTDNRCLIIDGRLAAFAPAGLTSYSIPEGVTSIGRYAFLRCENLTNVTLPNSLERIGIGAFHSCYSLNNIVIPNSVKIINGDAFGYCYAFTEFTIPDSVESIGEDEIFGTRRSILRCCHSLTTINSKYASSDKRCLIIDGKLNSFAGSGLDTYVIPNGVTAIEKSAFEKQGLINVTIPESVTSIGGSAFYNVWKMTSVTIPSNVEHIGESAFYACGNLAEVICTPTTPPTLAPRVFSEVKEDCNIYVPAGTYDAYVSAEGWSEYKDMIVEQEEVSDGPTQIVYTTTNGRIVTPVNNATFGANIVSNVYENGQGVITFDGPATAMTWGAFQNCTTLKTVTIPGSITNWEAYIFDGCTNLTTVTILDGVKSIGWGTFEECTKLTEIVMPESVTTIESYAFSGCDALKTITFPNNLTTIGEGAFYDCQLLSGVVIPNSVTSLGEKVFAICPNIGSFSGKFATSDGKSLIDGDTLLAIAPLGMTSYNIPEGITTIGLETFAYTTFGNITMPNSVTTIREMAFGGASIENITLSENLETIEERAFEWCENLQQINIPNSVTTIGDWAFSECPSLQEITGKFASDDNRCLVVNDRLVAFAPAGTTTCNIPQGITTICPGVFMNCSDLVSVVIPEGVTTIDLSAFNRCSSLVEVTLPSTVTTLESYAFYGCTSVTGFYCKAVTPPSVGSQALYGYISARRIYVPTESVDAYKSASGWSTFASTIVGYDF